MKSLWCCRTLWQICDPKATQGDFETLAGSKAIRFPLKPRIGNEHVSSRQPRRVLGSSESSESYELSGSINTPPNLRVIFTVHIDRSPDDSDLQSLVERVRSLDPFLGLELTGVHLSQSTLLKFSALGRVWLYLKGLALLALLAKYLVRIFCSPGSAIHFLWSKFLQRKRVSGN